MARALPMKRGFELLRQYKVPIAKGGYAKKEGDIVRAAAGIGYPVAIKLDSPDIVHKTEKGAVIPNIADEKGLRKAYRTLMRRAGKARVKGIVVQEHCSGKEIIIGGKQDPQFGAVVLFGLGGIFVEVLKDVSVRVTPVSLDDAWDMIEEIEGYPLLAGARGEKPVDMDAIARTIVKVSKLMDKSPEISELDINPLFVDQNGIKAVDIRVIVGK